MPLLFSYGTLQQESVQLSIFGRPLQGQEDQLVGFEQSSMKIEDPRVVAVSGKSDHTIVKFNGRNDSRVGGTVFELTDAELASADRYEVAPYKRVAAVLASGKQAWVYVDARISPAFPSRRSDCTRSDESRLGVISVRFRDTIAHFRAPCATVARSPASNLRSLSELKRGTRVAASPE